MKKIISAILAIMLLLTSVCSFAAEPKVTVDKLKIDVTVEYKNPPEKAAVQILDENKTKVWYNGECEVIDGIAEFKTFSLPKAVPTGAYIIRCTPDGVETCEKTVFIANYYEQIVKYNTLADTDAKDYSGIIDNGLLLGVDAAEYQELDDDISYLVNVYLSQYDWYVGEEGEYLDEKQVEFKAAFNTAMEGAYILSAEDTERYAELSYFSPDINKYYKMLSESGFLKRMANTAKEVTVIDSDEIYSAFDKAVLLASVDEFDYTTIEEVVEYYEEKKIIELDRKDYLKLSDSEKVTFWKLLKKETINDIDDIAEAFEKITEELLENGEDKKSGGNNRGGGGSSGKVTSGRTESVSGNAVTTEKELENNSDNSATETTGYSDLKGYEWAETAINVLSQNGIIAGKGGGKFAPEDNITREEFVKLIAVLLDLPKGEEPNYSDISKDDWCYEYIASSTAANIISGTGDGRFGKGQSITRQDMVVILQRAAEYSDTNLDAIREISFKDANDISDYAKEAVVELSNAGIINGVGNGMFAPHNYVTRAEAAKAVYEVYNRMEAAK